MLNINILFLYANNEEGRLMPWKIDDVPVYIAVVDNQGVSAAARAMNLSKSTVSKSVSRLEEALGIRLLERNSRNVRLTSEGRVFYHHCVQIMEQVTEANAVMAGLTSVPKGKLVVALPMAFCREFVAPNLARFRKVSPGIDLEIIITSHPVDIIRDNIDLAVVIGSLSDSDLVVKKLYQSRLVWVASPGYVKQHRLGKTAEDLLSHIQICEKRYGVRRFPVRIGDDRQLINLTNRVMHVNDPIAVREAVINGCGVSLLPNQYCSKAIKAGSLVQVFKQIGFDASASELSAIYPSRRLISNKTRVFLNFLVDLCKKI